MIRHLDHPKDQPCTICDEPSGPWWFKGEPHIAFDGKVYCPHCTQILGSTMEKARERIAIHNQTVCEAWAEGTRARIEVEAVQEDRW